MLHDGLTPLPEFTRPEVAEVLSRGMKQKKDNQMTLKQTIENVK